MVPPGRTHLFGIVIVPAGKRMVEGLLMLVPFLSQGLVFAAQTSAEPPMPRASITIPAGGYVEGWRMPNITEQIVSVCPIKILASTNAVDPTQQLPEEL